MNFKCLVSLGLLTAGCALGQAVRPTLRLCAHKGPQAAITMLAQAKLTATQILADAGVDAVWECKSAGAFAAAETIEIDLDEDLVDDAFRPGAMAYASPFKAQGVRIRVFMRRIHEYYGKNSGALLGHVFAHEIGHVLEGVCRHSESGVLKAHFTAKEANSMEFTALRFAAEDVALIQAHFHSLTAAAALPASAAQ